MTDIDAFPPKQQRVQRFATLATVAFFAFILGFVPMWLTARTRGGERDAAQLALRLMGIENTLAAAAIHARRGEYEEARVAASTFYTDLQAEIERADSGFGASRGALQEILAERDETITLLARSDPAVAERLSTTYVAYREAAGLDRARRDARRMAQTFMIAKHCSRLLTASRPGPGRHSCATNPL